MKIIYRSYADTEVSVLATRIKCPHCGYETLEDDMDECGKTYIITCDEDDGCGREYEMHFDDS